MIMKNTKGIKRELTSDEWRAISVMWVKGESTKAICAAFPKCHINSAMIRRRMNKDNVNLLKDEIDEEVMEYWRKLSDEFNKNYKYPSYREAYKAGLCDIIE